MSVRCDTSGEMVLSGDETTLLWEDVECNLDPGMCCQTKSRIHCRATLLKLPRDRGLFTYLYQLAGVPGRLI